MFSTYYQDCSLWRDGWPMDQWLWRTTVLCSRWWDPEWMNGWMDEWFKKMNEYKRFWRQERRNYQMAPSSLRFASEMLYLIWELVLGGMGLVFTELGVCGTWSITHEEVPNGISSKIFWAENLSTAFTVALLAS